MRNINIFQKFKSSFQKKVYDYVRYSYFGNYNNPYWSIQSDRDYITEAYNSVVWVYACVSKISSCVGSIKWCLYRKNMNGKLFKLDEHPILNMLNRVNPNMSGVDFFDMWATYLALNGKFYALYNNPALPTEMYYLYPFNTRPIPNEQMFVSGFEYQSGSERQTYQKDEVLWDRFYDPLNSYDGLSPIRAMARTINTENEAIRWNKSSLENNGVPPGVFQVENPGPEMIEKLKEKWREDYGGSSNARTPLVLDSSKADYKSIGLNQTDMDFLNQRKLNRIEICSGFEVPSQIVGDPEGQTYSNYKEAMKSFWENTIIPKYITKMCDTLNTDLVSRYADNLVLKPDLDGVTALNDSLDTLSNRAIELFDSGLLTQNEARQILNYEENKNDDGNKFSYQLKKVEKKEESKNNNNNKKVDNINDLELKKKDNKIARIEKEREEFYNSFEKNMKIYFENERKLIKAWFKNANEKSKITEILVIVNKHKKQLFSLFEKEFKSCITHFSKFQYDELVEKYVKEKAYNIDEETNKFILENIGEEIKEINETTLNSIKQRVKFGIAEGYSIPQIGKLIDDLYLKQIIPNRSSVIAITEVNTASNFGSWSGAKKAVDEFDLKILKAWIPTGDKRTRPTHKDMALHEPIKMDKLFRVGRSMGMYPGDPRLPGRERIRCRCAIIYNR